MSKFACHGPLIFAQTLNADQVEAFASFVVDYNDSSVSRYRKIAGQILPGMEQVLKYGIEDMRGFLFFVGKGGKCEVLRSFDPEAFSMAAGVISAEVGKAEQRLAQERYGDVIAHLEGALSAAHDLVETLLDRLTFRPEPNNAPEDTARKLADPQR
jgi:hypothetical protein